MLFELTLEDRVAIYNPENSQLTWKDNFQPVINLSTEPKKVDPALSFSPSNPIGKLPQMKKIKIQMGFACNYSCSYCSQSNLRAENKVNNQLNIAKIDHLFQKLCTIIDSGKNQLGADVDLEFWGGETLLYWSSIVYFAQKLKTVFPLINLSLFTNGSLINSEMISDALKYKIKFILSHDGECSTEFRGKDPLENPIQLNEITKVFLELNPHGLFAFNATINQDNISPRKIQAHLASKLNTNIKNIILSSDISTPYDESGKKISTNKLSREELINKIFEDLIPQYPMNMLTGNLQFIIGNFFDSLTFQIPANSLNQKCNMDLPSSIAFDLDGNVLTCQNTTATSGHKIGHLDNLESVQLSTAHHWSTREECTKCPVVHLCKGACMFLESELWDTACEQHFTWNLAYLAFALYIETGKRLLKISGENIRGKNIEVINVLT